MAMLAIALGSSAQEEAADTTFETNDAVVVDSLTLIQKIEMPGNIKIEIPEGLEKRLEYDGSAQEEEESEQENATQSRTRVGYRIMVFEDNNARTAKHDAEKRRRQVLSRFPEHKAYVQWKAPYWSVKFGDFKTRSEAEATLGALKGAFPSIGNQFRLVRDRINVTH